MKTAYTFATLRYVHDVVTGEFANVGVVLYSPGERYLDARFTTSYERLNAIFLQIDHTNYRNLIRYLSTRFAEPAVEIREGLDLAPAQGIEELVRRVLPQDDSSLQWSPPGGGFSGNLAETAGQFYHPVGGALHPLRRGRQPQRRGNPEAFQGTAQSGGGQVAGEADRGKGLPI